MDVCEVYVTPIDIINFRKRYYLTQFDLAKLIGCRQQTISEWELGIMKMGNAYKQIFVFMAERLEAIRTKHVTKETFLDRMSDEFGYDFKATRAIKRAFVKGTYVRKKKEG